MTNGVANARLEMITPIRGRKRKLSRANQSLDCGLEMITPIRGRKRIISAMLPPYSGIRNDNPDKGTETPTGLLYSFSSIPIRNDNPDKGTETAGQGNARVLPLKRLEMITPIRGRKLGRP